MSLGINWNWNIPKVQVGKTIQQEEMQNGLNTLANTISGRLKELRDNERQDELLKKQLEEKLNAEKRANDEYDRRYAQTREDTLNDREAQNLQDLKMRNLQYLQDEKRIKDQREYEQGIRDAENAKQVNSIRRSANSLLMRYANPSQISIASRADADQVFQMAQNADSMGEADVASELFALSDKLYKAAGVNERVQYNWARTQQSNSRRKMKQEEEKTEDENNFNSELGI